MVLLMFLAGAQAQSPKSEPKLASLILGKWKLNVAKSTYNPGPTTNSLHIREYTTRPDGFVVVTVAQVDTAGRPNFVFVAAKYDEKDYPVYNGGSLTEQVVAGTKPTNTYAYKVIDDYTLEIISKTNGKAANQKWTRSVSKDGKTLTDHTKGINSEGKPFENIQILEKQP